jgi:hypothetical protein
MASGLIIKQVINIRGTGSTENVIRPSISKGWTNKSGYTCEDFISECRLPFMEIDHANVGKLKTYFVRVGEFSGEWFTIFDQLKGKVGGWWKTSAIL